MGHLFDRCRRSSLIVLAVAVATVTLGCRQGLSHSSFVAIRADRQINGTSKYPIAIDPSRVGTYAPEVKSGAGYFYDDVLEYRVWFHPEKGAAPLNGGSDYFEAFAQYERAKASSDRTPGAEPPLVLVRQTEWIDEPKRGKFTRETGLRLTEWQVAWLTGSRRTEHSIDDFLTHPREAGP
jgi:hypothetical protein